jgi:glutathione-regulated potassium-efflux system ancillary protein KefC
VAALGLALSSTAIALQVMGERNLLPTTSGQAGFSILLFQDVAAIPILALLPLLGVAAGAADGAADASRWLEAAKIIGVIAGIVLGGRLLLRPALRWIAKSDTPEIFTAASLLLVVAIAALMQLVGLSMALGAFLAGVLLAESEYRRELETDIEPFKGLLLGLFFMAVGMSIDFGVLMKSPGLMALVVLGFLAVKGLVIYGLARLMGVPFQERPVFTLLLAQGGEFAFVVFQAAAGARVFPAETASLLIGAVAISMLLSPLLLVLVDKLLLPRFANCNVTTMERAVRTPGRRHHHCRLRPLRPDHRAHAARRRASGPPCWITTPRWWTPHAPSATRCSTATPPGSTCCARPVRPTPGCWWWRWTARNSRWRSWTGSGALSQPADRGTRP